MNEKQLRTVVGNLRRVISPNPASRIADAQLLERFLQCRDELAFEMLVWRHGSMVLNVCRRVLRDSHEAQDAFQATFLIFVRKLRSIGKREAVGSWLYKVAYRVALRAKERTAARRLEPHADLDQLPGMSADDPAQTAAWRDLRPVLDEEVNRLPEKYRTPFVLYYLEGMAYPEVAEELGCPKGTVSSRLTTAKGLLRKRLLRRGVALSAALFAGTLTKASSAAMTIALTTKMTKTIHFMASGKTAGADVVSAQALTLAEGVMKAMLMSKMKLAAVLVLAVGLLGFGATVAIQQGVQGAPPAAGTTPKPPATTDDKRSETTDGTPGISLGAPVPVNPGQASQNQTAPQQPQRFIDWPIIDPNQVSPFATPTYSVPAAQGYTNSGTQAYPPGKDPLADRLTKIEERLTHLEEQMAKLQAKPAAPKLGNTSGSSTSSGGLGSSSSSTNFTNPFGISSTGATGSSTSSSITGSPFGASTTKGGDKPIPINARRFTLPVAMDEKEAYRIAKVELYVSDDQGKKWALAAAFTSTKQGVGDVYTFSGATGSLREFPIQVPSDGEYWFKLHVIYKFGPTPEADFGAKTTPELKVLVNSKPLHSQKPKGEDNDALLSDLEAQLKALQAKIAELKAKQSRE
jgi:RNA polymerase sigma factor (sigma-70 family)